MARGAQGTPRFRLTISQSFLAAGDADEGFSRKAAAQLIGTEPPEILTAEVYDFSGGSEFRQTCAYFRKSRTYPQADIASEKRSLRFGDISRPFPLMLDSEIAQAPAAVHLPVLPYRLCRTCVDTSRAAGASLPEISSRRSIRLNCDIRKNLGKKQGAAT